MNELERKQGRDRDGGGLKHGIKAMLRNGGGAIVNNASVAGLAGFPGDAILPVDGSYAAR